MAGNKIPVSVLVVIFSAAGRFLLIERADKPGYWQSVTGSLDRASELPIDAAVRELSEETGIKATAEPGAPALKVLPYPQLVSEFKVRPWPHWLEYEIFEHWRHRYPEGVRTNKEHWFHVCVPEGIIPELAVGEHVAYEWVDSQEAQRRCFSPNNAQAIASLSAHLYEKQGNMDA